MRRDDLYETPPEAVRKLVLKAESLGRRGAGLSSTGASTAAAVATKLEKQSPAPTFAPAGTSEEKAESSKTMTPQSAPSGQPSAATTTTTVGTKMDAPVSGQPSETSDSILNKAKATIAAKMENAAAVEFVDAKRAIRKNTLGQPSTASVATLKGKINRVKKSARGNFSISSRRTRPTLSMAIRNRYRRPRTAISARTRIPA
jgi:hypothetical protein